MESISETGDLLGLNFHIEEGTYWDNVFKPLSKALDTARLAIDAFNAAYELMLELTGQSKPVDLTTTQTGLTVDPATGRTVPIAGGGGATTVTTTVNIGTEKVDTVVSGALRRINPGGRGGNQ
jgi:replicative DNA helicase